MPRWPQPPTLDEESQTKAFEDALTDMAEKIVDYDVKLATEEATKTAIVMPFISRVLGYDVFNPGEVVPEYIADLGLKKGEKIDFAIVRDGNVQMLIEAKKIGEPLQPRPRGTAHPLLPHVQRSNRGAHQWQVLAFLHRPRSPQPHG